MADASVNTRTVEVSAIIYSPCKNCGGGSTGPGTIEEAHKRNNPDCPGYVPSYPARPLGVITKRT